VYIEILVRHIFSDEGCTHPKEVSCSNGKQFKYNTCL